MVKRGFRRLAAWILAAAVALTGCGGGRSGDAQGTPPQGDQARSEAPTQPGGSKQVTIGIWSSPNTFNPISYDTTYTYLIIRMLYPTLLEMNDKLEFEGRLAEKWTVSDDKTKFTFYLNKNARWTDGTPITAHDVAATVSMIARPETKTTRRSLIDTIAGLDENGTAPEGKVSGIRVVDDHTIEFTTKGPVDPDAFLEKLGVNVFIVPKALLDQVQNPAEIDREPWSMEPKVTGGPFKFVRYVTDQYVELEKNPDYWLGEPKLDKIFVRIVPRATIAAALEKGEIDMTGGAGIGEVPVEDWEKVAAMPHLTPATYVAPSYQYMDVNAAQPHLSDPRVRRAFAHAINRQLIVDRLLKGQGEVLNTPLNSANKYYRPELQKELEYNPEKAKQLLQEAGWDFNREIVLLTPTGNTVREQSADIIQANLQAVGVKVRVQKVDFPTRQAMAQRGEWEISLVGFSATFDPDFSSQVSAKGAYNYRRLPGAENDNKKYHNPRLDELLLQGKNTADFEERMRIYTEAQKVFIEDLPLIPLYAPKALVVVNKRVTGVKPGPQGLTWNTHEWDVTQ